MKSKHNLKKILFKIGLAGSAIAISPVSLAQSSFFFPSASFFSPAAAFYQSEDGVNLDQMLESLPQHESFSTQLEKAGLWENLPQDSLTILAPTNEAFAALSPQVKSKLAQPENLTKLLQYHIVVGIISEQDIKRQAVATLLEQSSVQITGIPLADNQVGVKINQSIASDPLAADNGVVIPINEVLIPPGF